jgi:hypothetical protein
MEDFENLKYPSGDDFKREYGKIPAKLSEKDAKYLVKNGRLFLRKQAGYDPSESLEATTNESMFGLLYGNNVLEGVAGFGYTNSRYFERFHV